MSDSEDVEDNLLVANRKQWTALPKQPGAGNPWGNEVFTAYYPLIPTGAALLGPKEGKMVCAFNGKSLSRKTSVDRLVQQICGADYKTKMKLGSDYTQHQALYDKLFTSLSSKKYVIPCSHPHAPPHTQAHARTHAHTHTTQHSPPPHTHTSHVCCL